ncbi:MAG: glycosyltransferase [Cytophagaceae bacterium]
MYNEIDINEFLTQFSGTCVDYLPNNGNVGDILIFASTLQVFQRHKISFQTIEGNEDERGDVLFLGGGGNLIDDYCWLLPRLQKLNRNYDKVVILPHTIFGKKVLEVFEQLGENVYIFCREKKSYDFLFSSLKHKENIFLSNDMAFHFDYFPYKSKKTHGILNAFRKDGEKGVQDIPVLNIDLSDELQLKGKPYSTEFWRLDYWMDYLDDFLGLISQHNVIRTNRLHVAIAGALMDKKVEFYPNSYFKNEAVYSFSLANHKNVSFKEYDNHYFESLAINYKSIINNIPEVKEPANPEISIVIPVFNDGIFLLEAIESIFIENDGSVSIEILIVNDGSTNFTTLEILNSLQSKGFKVLHKQNEGLAKTRNYAIEHAGSSIILPLDADNKVKYQYLVKALDCFKDLNVGVVYGNVKLFGAVEAKKEVSDFDLSLLLAGNYIDACALFRKEVWEKAGGYDTGLLNKIGYEDWDFWIRVAKSGYSFHHIDEFLFYYRVRNNSMVSGCNDPDTRYQLVKYIVEKNCEVYASNVVEVLGKLHKHLAGIDELLKNSRQREHDLEAEIVRQASVAGEEKERFRKELLFRSQEELLHKDNHINNLYSIIEHMRLKNRVKRAIKRIVPQIVLRGVKSIFRLTRKWKAGYDSLKRIKPIKEEIKELGYKPKISILIPVYNTDPKWLALAIGSVEKQYYTNWELCIADDCSTKQETIDYLKGFKGNNKIKVVRLEENSNISEASNAALKLCTGEYVALLDHDDELTPDALFEVVKVLNETDADLVYSDEDKIDSNDNLVQPHFKPDFSPDLLLSQNYISHLGVYKKSIVDEIGGFRRGFEGSQDYDLVLRFTERTNKIVHIPKILYHWRMIPGSTAVEHSAKSYAHQAGKRALENAMKRRRISGDVLDGKHPGTYRVQRAILNNPKVSIIIPFKDKPELLSMCINSLISTCGYSNIEIIGVSNNSTQNNTFSLMKELQKMDKRIKFIEYNVPFNYSQINNYAASVAEGEHLLFLNNDIEFISSGWLEALLEHSQRPETGAIGAKLYYPNNTIQHAGVIIGPLTLAGHSHRGSPKDHPGYFARLDLVQNLSAVTAACLMVKKEVFLNIGGFNEKDLKVAFNDVDLCLRLREKEYLNIYTPYCEAYHHESISRGSEDTPEKQERFSKEVQFMLNRHQKILAKGDPYYNLNLTLEKEDFSLRG